VRTYSDSEGEEYHGMVVNLAQARAHLESILGQFSLDLLIQVIRHGFFNHEGFLLAYAGYRQATGRTTEKLSDRLKDILMSRGIAWYASASSTRTSHRIAPWNRRNATKSSGMASRS